MQSNKHKERSLTEAGDSAVRKIQDRAVTIKDVAAHLGISYSAVSRALSDHRHTSADIKERVRRAVEELGYVPHAGARMMHQPSSAMVGLIVPDIKNQIFAASASVIAAACRKEGYQLILSVSERNPRIEYEQLRLLRQSRVAGVIIAPCGDSLPETLRLLSSLPVVQLARRNQTLAVPTVSINDRQGAHSAVRHLTLLGHRRIAIIGGEPEVVTNRERVAGACDGLVEAGIEVEKSLLLTGPLTSEFGRTAVIRLWSKPKPPTAILAVNSLLTLGVIEAIHQLNLSVPDCLSVIGFGDPEWFRLWGPGLTTVDLPIQPLAETAASLLLGQIGQQEDGRDPSRSLSLETSLIVRGSTAPPSG